MADRSLGERLFVGLQYLLPQHTLSNLMRAVSRARTRLLKDALIRLFMRFYAVNLGEAECSEPGGYPSFNAFFTRRLRPGARHVDSAPEAVVSPVDGVVSQAGLLDDDTLLQAKGLGYSATALLGGSAVWADRLAGGAFATIYLAPHHYHRVHMPLAGTLQFARYVAGDLFSVNATTVAGVPGLFTRNERVACVFDGAAGPFAVVLVGAIFVGNIGLAWTGEIKPAGRRSRELAFAGTAPAFDKGAELGQFNLGSTVVLLLPPGRAKLDGRLRPGLALRMGERIATLS